MKNICRAAFKMAGKAIATVANIWNAEPQMIAAMNPDRSTTSQQTTLQPQQKPGAQIAAEQGFLPG